MEWSIAIVALTLLGVAAISRTLYGTPVTPAMVLVAAGLLLGPEVLGGVDIESSSVVVQSLAEVTLALVLFCDASRIDLRQLRLDFGVPIALYAVLSLTVVRMLPVVIAMWGTRAKSPTLGFLGLVRPPRPGLDRVRGDHCRGGEPAARAPDRARDLPDGGAVSVRAWRQRRSRWPTDTLAGIRATRPTRLHRWRAARPT